MSTTARTHYRPGLTELIRRESYLTRLDWGLRSLPSGQSRMIQRDLRRDVTATAAEVGMRAALADLGTPGALAAQYTANIDPEGPRYYSGSVAAGVTFGAIVFLLLAYAIGTLDTLWSVGGGTRTVNLWGSEAVFIATAEQISFEINALPVLLVIAAVSGVAFLLFSRIWRLGRRSG